MKPGGLVWSKGCVQWLLQTLFHLKFRSYAIRHEQCLQKDHWVLGNSATHMLEVWLRSNTFQAIPQQCPSRAFKVLKWHAGPVESAESYRAKFSVSTVAMRSVWTCGYGPFWFAESECWCWVTHTFPGLHFKFLCSTLADQLTWDYLHIQKILHTWLTLENSEA